MSCLGQSARNKEAVFLVVGGGAKGMKGLNFEEKSNLGK